MSNQQIFCGICGRPSDTSLLQHIRDDHNTLPEAYRQRCPNAPLFTDAFGEYLRDNGVQVDGDRVMATHDLFGVTVNRVVAVVEHIPAIDDKFAFDKELAKAVLLSLVANDRIMLVGPTGSGKSSLIAQLAARLDRPLRRINLHGETSVSDFVGVHKARSGEVFFQHGILPIAMRDGQILVLEEADAATPEILFILQGVLEDGGALTIADNGGEVIEPHPDFRLVATANTLGVGDESSLYTGTNVLNASFLDRWTTVFNVGYLGDKAEAAVIRDKVPELGHSLVEGMVNLVVAVRKAVENQDLYTTFSTRRLLALARKTVPLGLEKALEVTVLNKLPATERAVVAELAQRHLQGLEGASLASA